MKRLAFLFAFLAGVCSSAFAVDTIGDAKYTNFVHKNELWVCSSIVLPIDMAISAFNTNMPPEGRWVEVYTGTYLDASVDIPASSVKVLNASNIFNPVGRNPGIYDFVYISGSDDFCGMSIGQKSIFRIYLVPELTGFYVTTNLCKDEKVMVDFTKYIPTDVKSFADMMGWSFVFKDATATAVAMPVEASSAATGLKTYTYGIDDSALGAFKGKYSGMNPLYACSAEAKLTHLISLKQSGISIADKSLSYCFDNLVSGSSSYPTYTFDLNSILSVGTATGTWKRISPDYGTVTAGGVVAIKTNDLKVAVDLNPSLLPYDFEYLYIYQNCDGKNDTAKVNIIMADETVLSPLLQSASRNVCRASAPGNVNLLDYFGISVPSTSGVWINPDGSLGTGVIDISALSTVGSYQYKYAITSAVDDLLCGLQDHDVTLTLSVRDITKISSGEAQICLAKYNEGNATINLFNHVSGLTGVPETDVKWYQWVQGSGFSSTPIANPTAYPATSANLNPGVNQFKFVHINDCGEMEGKLYISVTDRMTNFKDKIVEYCFTDPEAKNINLNQLLGVLGLKNKWEFVKSSTNVANLGTNFDPNTGVFKGYDIFNQAAAGVITDYSETYEFKYIAADDDCVLPGKKEATITIVLTENLVHP